MIGPALNPSESGYFAPPGVGRLLESMSLESEGDVSTMSHPTFYVGRPGGLHTTSFDLMAQI